MPNYTTTILPNPFPGATSIQITDIDDDSVIDVVRLLGKPAKKMIIIVKASDTINVEVNNAVRRTLPFIKPLIDVEGNTSALTVVQARETADRDINVWGGGGSLTIAVANNAPSPGSTWNSYKSYGELIIENVIFDTNTDLDVTFVV